MIEKKLKDTPIHYWINETNLSDSIIFIHSAFADHTCFDYQVAYFKNKYKIITIDLIGHGKSVNSKIKGSIDDTSNYIIQIMNSEKIDKINLVGISIGAILVQDFANKYPDKILSLCSIGGYDINNFDKNLQKGNSKEQLKMMLKAIFSTKLFAKDNKKISAYTEEAQEKFYQMNINFKKSSLRYLATLGKLVNKYKTIKRNYPLLIGCGEHDNEMAIKASKMWVENEPNSEFVLFKGAGHIVNMDIPDEFNKTLEKILK